tara:strand:+ start:286 stop:813 length:528 start_codon:yes stop_codon:yes gene_type:complete
MALWGTKDTVYSTGKVDCTTAGVLTRQAGTIAWTAGNGVKVGQVVTLASDGAGQGQGIIKSIDVATGNSAQITLTNLDLPGAFTAVDYEIRETPKSEVNGGRFAIGEVFGVDTTEITVANAASGEARKYAPPHAGWVGITTYNDMHGNFRVKHEVLVAGSSITGDSGDDTILPDS